jgi:hypothetical protein
LGENGESDWKRESEWTMEIELEGGQPSYLEWATCFLEDSIAHGERRSSTVGTLDMYDDKIDADRAFDP